MEAILAILAAAAKAGIVAGGVGKDGTANYAVADAKDAIHVVVRPTGRATITTSEGDTETEYNTVDTEGSIAMLTALIDAMIGENLDAKVTSLMEIIDDIGGEESSDEEDTSEEDDSEGGDTNEDDESSEEEGDEGEDTSEDDTALEDDAEDDGTGEDEGEDDEETASVPSIFNRDAYLDAIEVATATPTAVLPPLSEAVAADTVVDTTCEAAAVEVAAVLGADKYRWFKYGGDKARTFTKNAGKGVVKLTLRKGGIFGVRNSTSGGQSWVGTKGTYRLVGVDSLSKVHTISYTSAQNLMDKSTVAAVKIDPGTGVPLEDTAHNDSVAELSAAIKGAATLLKLPILSERYVAWLYSVSRLLTYKNGKIPTNQAIEKAAALIAAGPDKSTDIKVPKSLDKRATDAGLDTKKAAAALAKTQLSPARMDSSVDARMSTYRKLPTYLFLDMYDILSIGLAIITKDGRRLKKHGLDNMTWDAQDELTKRTHSYLVDGPSIERADVAAFAIAWCKKKNKQATITEASKFSEIFGKNSASVTRSYVSDLEEAIEDKFGIRVPFLGGATIGSLVDKVVKDKRNPVVASVEITPEVEVANYLHDMRIREVADAYALNQPSELMASCINIKVLTELVGTSNGFHVMRELAYMIGHNEAYDVFSAINLLHQRLGSLPSVMFDIADQWQAKLLAYITDKCGVTVAAEVRGAIIPRS